jgi:hypothetical protein
MIYVSFVAVDAALFPGGLPDDFPVSVETIESKKIVGIEVLSAAKARDRNEFRTPCIAAFVTSPAVAINPLVPVFVVKVAVTDEEVAGITDRVYRIVCRMHREGAHRCCKAVGLQNPRLGQFPTRRMFTCSQRRVSGV